MDNDRTVEDRLREEYFDLLPEIRRTVIETETRVRRELLESTLALQRYERLLVTSRTKECESAVDALRRRQTLGFFDPERADTYSLTSLPDLAAGRVMAFPQQRFDDARIALSVMLTSWTADPVPGISEAAEPLALKYFGKWNVGARANTEIKRL